MPWYRAGSVAVTNGSAIVTGAGTDFVGNTQAGEVFLGPDGRVYEISAVQSAAQLTIIPNYQGASAGGQAYGIQPTASFARDLAVLAAQMLNTFGAVRDGIGQGLMPDGTVFSPGLRFAADQDTGLRRAGDNVTSLTCAGVDRLLIGPFGATVRGRATVAQGDTVGVPAPTLGTLPPSSAFFGIEQVFGLLIGTYGSNGSCWLQAQRTDGNASAYNLLLQPSGGNLLVGTAEGATTHVVQNSRAGSGEALIDFRMSGGFTIAAVYAIDFNGVDGANAANSAFKCGRSSTGRSISTSGTVNANGADYAEYMLKAAGCGIIAKGDVCGVDRDGKLTKTWVDAISFVVKSTDPSLVGGDTWASHLRPKPEQPAAEPQAPIFPAVPTDGTDEALIAASVAAQAAYPALLASYQSEHSAWQQAMDAYAADLAAWEDELETARQCVDRIAFCGQVPCNVTGEFDVGDYIIAAANGAGIKAVSVKPDEITLAQYMRRIGKVWAIRDGRAWIDVQHG